jgi:hypothetical protein
MRRKIRFKSKKGEKEKASIVTKIMLEYGGKYKAIFVCDVEK